MRNFLYSFSILFLIVFPIGINAQTLFDDFQGTGNISNWSGDNCLIDTNFNNPVATGINTTTKVLKYQDIGGQYANIRFETGRNLNLSINNTLTLKIYVPSSGITGTQNNQVSLKLQDGTLGSPWTTQCEIIKNINLNQWQTVTFDFANDPYINANSGSPAPWLRNDFNRVLIQVNGENNTDHVLAYIDDFYYYDTVPAGSAFSYLVWSDEFNVNGALDTFKWHHQTQLPASGSWYNGEVQHYTDRNVNSSISGGMMNLIAKKETFTDQGHTKQYTSARLNSKFAFKYGRVEVRAKLPTGVGTWPAIWMLGKNINEQGAYFQLKGYGTTSWPACGEIDIMEHWGSNQNFVQSAIHTPSSHGATVNHGGRTIPTVSSGFHIYAVEWTDEKIVFSVDSVIHYVYNPTIKDASTWPFDKEQYILLNIAIQSSIAPSFTQDTMNIDYVRVYKRGYASTEEKIVQKAPHFYPNPVTDQLTIELNNSATQSISLRLTNSQGQLLRAYNINGQQNLLKLSNLGDLKKGIYFVSYAIDNKPFRLKFIKQ